MVPFEYSACVVVCVQQHSQGDNPTGLKGIAVGSWATRGLASTDDYQQFLRKLAWS